MDDLPPTLAIRVGIRRGFLASGDPVGLNGAALIE